MGDKLVRMVNGVWGDYPRVALKKVIGDDEWNRLVLSRYEPPEKKYPIRPSELRTEWNYEPVEHEPVICGAFGCGKTLSITEQLFGNKCINHQI